MSLTNFWEKIKSKARFETPESDIPFDEEGEVVKFPLVRRVWLALVIILAMTLSFGLGKLSNLNSDEPIKIDYESIDNSLFISSSVEGKTENSTANTVTASSKGTRYYYSWCRSTVSLKNKVSFANAILAEKAGYTLAVNCTAK